MFSDDWVKFSASNYFIKIMVNTLHPFPRYMPSQTAVNTTEVRVVNNMFTQPIWLYFNKVYPFWSQTFVSSSKSVKIHKKTQPTNKQKKKRWTFFLSFTITFTYKMVDAGQTNFSSTSWLTAPFHPFTDSSIHSLFYLRSTALQSPTGRCSKRGEFIALPIDGCH